MSMTSRWSSLTITLGLCLLLPLGAVAQSETTAEDEAVVVPQIEGLGWYRSLELTGPQIESTRDEDEVAQWTAMLEGAGATFDQLEYTYQAAFDPSALPQIGGLATFRIDGVDTTVLREAVIGDIVAQFTIDGGVPATREATIGDKDVAVISLPEAVGIDEAIVYASGEVAYVFLMEEDLAALGLAQLP